MEKSGSRIREYPDKLYHRVPSWVEPGAMFHIRLRVACENKTALTEPRLAAALLDSVRVYEDKLLWFNHLFLLMPDHLHAILSFSRQKAMSRAVGEWKTYHCRANGVCWQSNYFDHRLRHMDELTEKAAYIRRNPIARGLCGREQDWPYVLEMRVPDVAAGKVDAAVPAASDRAGTARSTGRGLTGPEKARNQEEGR